MTPTRTVFLTLLLTLMGAALWVWYDSSPPGRAATTTAASPAAVLQRAQRQPQPLPQTQRQPQPLQPTPPPAASTAARTTPQLQVLHDSLESLRQQLYRSEANLRYELTATYQRLARLEQSHQSIQALTQGDASALRGMAEQMAQLARLSASSGFADSQRLFVALGDWLDSRPEFAQLAVQLEEDAARVREWDLRYQTLNNELDEIERAFAQLPTQPSLPENSPRNAASPEHRNLLQTVKNYINESFRISRSDSTAAKQPSASETPRFGLLIAEMRLMARHRAARELTRLKPLLLAAVQKSPPSSQRTELQERIKWLAIPAPLAFASPPERP